MRRRENGAAKANLTNFSWESPKNLEEAYWFQRDRAMGFGFPSDTPRTVIPSEARNLS
jgi:hypothetical protein